MLWCDLSFVATVDEPGNMLLLFRPLEKLYDDSRIVILPEDDDQFRLRVICKHTFDQKASLYAS